MIECFFCNTRYDQESYDRCPECGFVNRSTA